LLVLVGVFVAGVLFGATLMRFLPAAAGRARSTSRSTSSTRRRADREAARDRRRPPRRADATLDVQPRARAVLFAIEDELRASLTRAQILRLESWRARRPAPVP
jgi:hypothetical protein